MPLSVATECIFQGLSHGGLVSCPDGEPLLLLGFQKHGSVILEVTSAQSEARVCSRDVGEVNRVSLEVFYHAFELLHLVFILNKQYQAKLAARAVGFLPRCGQFVELSLAQLAPWSCLVSVLAKELLYLVDLHFALVDVSLHVFAICDRHQGRVLRDPEALTEFIRVAHFAKAQLVEVSLTQGFHHCGRLLFVSEVEDLVLVVTVDELIVVGKSHHLNEVLHFPCCCIRDLVPVHGANVLLSIVLEVLGED